MLNSKFSDDDEYGSAESSSASLLSGRDFRSYKFRRLSLSHRIRNQDWTYVCLLIVCAITTLLSIMSISMLTKKSVYDCLPVKIGDNVPEPHLAPECTFPTSIVPCGSKSKYARGQMNVYLWYLSPTTDSWDLQPKK
jgi:hypothetical protein